MGTLIRHARCLRLSAPVVALPVLMIQSPFRTPLVARVGAAMLIGSGGAAAIVAAIAMPAVAMLADPEHGLAAAT